uniref:Chloride channel protein n=1 Tax=Panagrolaimus sp. ES5 TaxID=591445 RepID=A0AC34GTR7_9BILA
MSEVNITRHGCSDDIIYRWTDDEDISESHRVLPTLFGYLFTNFFLIAICISLAIPAGIFIPSFVIGACCGRIIGETMFLLFPQGIRGLAGTQIYPGLYSLVGASAFTGALTHSFSIAVIVCEASKDLLIATPQLKSYPLVNNSTDRIMLGSVGRKYLYYMLTTQIGPDPSLLQRRASGNTSDLYSTYRKGSAINTNSVRFTDRHIQGNTLLSTSPLHEDHVSRNSPLAPLLRRQTLPEITVTHSLLGRDVQLLKPIELDEAAIDAAPFQLVLGTSIYKVHSLFSLLGLNHAFVTHQGALIGVVGLKEIRNVMFDINSNIIQRKNFIFHPSNPLLNKSSEKNVEQLINDESDESDDENSIILPAVTVSKEPENPEYHEIASYDTDGDDDVFESASFKSQKTQ